MISRPDDPGDETPLGKAIRLIRLEREISRRLNVETEDELVTTEEDLEGEPTQT